MIWGLFAPAPVVVRMPSSAYRASEWCERESELLDRLLERGDFLTGRVVVDANESETTRLDSLIEIPGGEGERAFPPRVELLSLPLLSESAAGLLRAAAAVRFIAVIASGAPTCGWRRASALSGKRSVVACPTNNVGGWDDYVSIFRALPSASSSVHELPIRLAADYDASTFGVERVWWAKNSPDFGDPRVPSLDDHLCAASGNACWATHWDPIARRTASSSTAGTLARGLGARTGSHFAARVHVRSHDGACLVPAIGGRARQWLGGHR